MLSRPLLGSNQGAVCVLAPARVGVLVNVCIRRLVTWDLPYLLQMSFVDVQIE